jgi:hypothetical protein
MNLRPKCSMIRSCARAGILFRCRHCLIVFERMPMQSAAISTSAQVKLQHSIVSIHCFASVAVMCHKKPPVVTVCHDRSRINPRSLVRRHSAAGPFRTVRGASCSSTVPCRRLDMTSVPLPLIMLDQRRRSGVEHPRRRGAKLMAHVAHVANALFPKTTFSPIAQLCSPSVFPIIKYFIKPLFIVRH